jgi:imidazolonepropionase-like amidohydrolase
MPGLPLPLRSSWLPALLAAIAFSLFPLPSHASSLAVRAGLLIPISRPPIRNGVVLIRDRRIAAVGANLRIPPGTPLVRARVAMPGLIDAHSYLGCLYETDEPVDALTPDLRACDALDLTHPTLQRALRAGVTTAAVAPGNGNVIAGQVALVKLGAAPEILAAYAGQKLSISAEATSVQRNPTSRAGLLELARGALDGARNGRGASGTLQPALMEGFPTLLDERCRALRPLLAGRVPAFIHAPAADDIESALDLIGSFNLRACLLHASEAASVCDLLKARQIPVVLGPLRFTDRDRTLANAGMLSRAGIPVAFCTDAPLGDPASLRLTAHLAVKYGMPRAAALRALTLDAARILGAARRAGSLEPGKDADLLLLSGDPLDLTSRVEGVVVNGSLVYGGVRREMGG